MDVLIATKRSYLAVVPLWSSTYLSTEDITSLWDLPLYHRPPIKIAGEWKAQPRDVGFFSDTSEGYWYSGQLMPSKPLTPAATILLEQVNAYLNTEFNGVLINYYRDGNDKLGAHSDSPTGLDKYKMIVAGVAFGAVRNFRIRYKNAYPQDLIVSASVDVRSEKSTIIADIPHQEGMLLVMAGDFQDEFTHEIPSVTTSKVSLPRLSLTFRHHTH